MELCLDPRNTVASAEDADANSAEIVNGWRYSMGGGRAGYDLALRAAFATHLLRGNVPEQLFGGGFNLTMRLYGAESPILDGSYRLPAVTRLD